MDGGYKRGWRATGHGSSCCSSVAYGLGDSLADILAEAAAPLVGWVCAFLGITPVSTALPTSVQEQPSTLNYFLLEIPRITSISYNRTGTDTARKAGNPDLFPYPVLGFCVCVSFLQSSGELRGSVDLGGKTLPF